jgi:Rab-like protein 2
MTATEKTFNFAAKRDLPFYFVSAADGTNVVRIFKHAIELAKKYRDNPEKDFVTDVLELLAED